MAKFPIEFTTPHAGLQFLEYHNSFNVYHPGVDLNKGKGWDDLGEPIIAPIDSKVEYISHSPTPWNSQNKGFGLFVILYHPAYAVWSRFAHLRETSLSVGQMVSEGEVIANLGLSGTESPHLHWEMFGREMYKFQKERSYLYYPSGKSKRYVSENYINPMAFISSLKSYWAYEYETVLIEEGIIRDRKPLEGERGEFYKIIVNSIPRLKKIYEKNKKQ